MSSMNYVSMISVHVSVSYTFLVLTVTFRRSFVSLVAEV